MTELEKLELKADKLEEEINKVEQDCFERQVPWDKIIEMTQNTRESLSEVYFQIKKLTPTEWSDIPEYGDVMPISLFKECVEEGLFMDTDGFGEYANGATGKVSNKEIYPSEFKKNRILEEKEFTHVIWFNK